MKKIIVKKVLPVLLAFDVVCSLDGCMESESRMGSSKWAEAVGNSDVEVTFEIQ